MASAVTRAGALDLLEDAVHALRQAPLATLLCHWTGSIPFALALALFWVDITRHDATDTRSIIDAFALALVLVWMNCWRAVFAGRLRRQLSGTVDPPWSRRRLWRLVTAQAFLGGTKLAVLPLATAALFPLVGTVAFYRNATAMADRDDLELPTLVTKARKLAALDQAQNWLLILILALLYLVAFLNVTVMLALLPQLVRILTGYETAFSRAGISLLENSLFWISVVLTTWLMIDPLVQAAYCVRSFRGESLETGEDLRAALRAMRRPVEAAALLLLVMMVSAARARGEVASTDLDHSIRQTLSAHEYDWRLTPPESRRSSSPSWVVAVAERMVSTGKKILRALGRFIEWIFDWLRGRLAPLPGGAALPGAGLHWSIYLLIAALALGLGIAWRMRRPPAVAPTVAAAQVVSLEDENLVADRLPEESWLAMAEERLRAQDYRAALRALYLANLAWLGARAWIGIHAAKTNREYETELRRKARALPELSALFSRNVASFERAWYGMHEVSGDDTLLFRDHVERMKWIAVPTEVAE
jgi:hypothetical protein